ncbi:MAG: hypothetical protein QNJ98_15390 [Planctomycetota bacterium]|nr:hypothetical protein [Planctomycetota bacterium]
MPRASLLFVICLLPLLGACGDDPPTADPDDGQVVWSHCTLVGVRGASGAAVLGDELFVCQGGKARALYAVKLDQLVSGARVAPRAIKLSVDGDEQVMGRELLAQRGYTLGGLWEADLDFQAVAVQQPDVLFLADARFRVVFWGKLAREIGGAFGRLELRHAFEVPGAQRANVDLADYSDTGPGIAGLFGVSGRARTEDLYLAERARPGGEEVRSQFRVLSLDRYGSLAGGKDLGFYSFDVGEGALPEVEGLAFDTPNARMLCIRGTGRGVIAPLRNPGSMRTGKVSQGVPGPEIDGVGRWRGLTVGADGTWVLVGDGDPAVVAWRTP